MSVRGEKIYPLVGGETCVDFLQAAVKVGDISVGARHNANVLRFSAKSLNFVENGFRFALRAVAGDYFYLFVFLAAFGGFFRGGGRAFRFFERLPGVERRVEIICGSVGEYRRRTSVFFEIDGYRAVFLFEVFDYFKRFRASPTVNGLKLIAAKHNVRAVEKVLHYLVLKKACILHFVHDNQLIGWFLIVDV